MNTIIYHAVVKCSCAGKRICHGLFSQWYGFFQSLYQNAVLKHRGIRLKQPSVMELDSKHCKSIKHCSQARKHHADHHTMFGRWADQAVSSLTVWQPPGRWAIATFTLLVWALSYIAPKHMWIILELRRTALLGRAAWAQVGRLDWPRLTYQH